MPEMQGFVLPRLTFEIETALYFRVSPFIISLPCVAVPPFHRALPSLPSPSSANEVASSRFGRSRLLPEQQGRHLYLEPAPSGAEANCNVPEIRRGILWHAGDCSKVASKLPLVSGSRGISPAARVESVSGIGCAHDSTRLEQNSKTSLL